LVNGHVLILSKDQVSHALVFGIHVPCFTSSDFKHNVADLLLEVLDSETHFIQSTVVFSYFGLFEVSIDISKNSDNKVEQDEG
jgi:hypothetical protein